MVLCTTNGEREEIVSPSFSEWIIKKVFWLRLTNLIKLVEKLGTSFQSQYLNLLCDVFLLFVKPCSFVV